MDIDSRNPLLSRLLDDLRDCVQAGQAWLHPTLGVRERGGELSLMASLDEGMQADIVRLPRDCLPRRDAFDLRVSNDNVEIVAVVAEQSPVQLRAMELMLAIYNECDKLAGHRSGCFWFTLAPWPGLVEKLLNGPGVGKLAKLHDLRTRGDEDGLLLETFLGTRTLNLKIGADKAGREVLMPFIDCANHHNFGPAFKGSRMGVALPYFRADKDNEECYAQYNFLDAMSSYLHYGFVDESSALVRSVPVTLDLGGGKTVSITAGGEHGVMLEIKALKDVGRYFSGLVRVSENDLRVNNVLLPDERQPLALRKLLKALVTVLDPLIGLTALTDKVLHLETEILAANGQYYRELAAMVQEAKQSEADASALQMLEKAVRLQLENLAAYEARMALLTA